MQIKKVYYRLNPQLLFDEIKDFVQKQGAIVDEAKLETYSLPGDSSSHLTRGTLVFKCGSSGKGEICMRAHIMGSEKTEVKLLLDITDELFTEAQTEKLQEDLDFILGSYERNGEED